MYDVCHRDSNKNELCLSVRPLCFSVRWPLTLILNSGSDRGHIFGSIGIKQTNKQTNKKVTQIYEKTVKKTWPLLRFLPTGCYVEGLDFQKKLGMPINLVGLYFFPRAFFLSPSLSLSFRRVLSTTYSKMRNTTFLFLFFGDIYCFLKIYRFRAIIHDIAL